MKLKKTIPFFLSLLITTVGFTENIVLENQTSYPVKNEKSKIAIQWATSVKEVQEGNNAFLYGSDLNQASVQVLTQSGTVSLVIPEKAEYFRVLVWSKEEKDPDLLTNWIDIVPNKTYTLKADYLVPAVLMSGSGC